MKLIPVNNQTLILKDHGMKKIEIKVNVALIFFTRILR